MSSLLSDTDEDKSYKSLHVTSPPRERRHHKSRMRCAQNNMAAKVEDCTRRSMKGQNWKYSLPHRKVPELTKYHKGRNVKHWYVTRLPPLCDSTKRECPLDATTIYSNKQASLYKLLTSQDNGLSTPSMCSPRFQQLKKDPALVRERDLIEEYRDGLTSTQWLEEYIPVPSVYPDSLRCESKQTSYKQSYVEEQCDMEHNDVTRRELPIHNQSSDSDIPPPCSTPTFETISRIPNPCYDLKRADHVRLCQYCDVIGAKYCVRCQEYRNRQYAWCYEQQFLPFI